MGRNWRICRAVSGVMLRFLACSLFGYSFLAFPVYAKQPLRVGDVPPDSLGKSSTGDKVRLSDYRGKIVIISFWASWCSPCRKELPLLALVQKKATRDKVVVFAVNWKESRDRYHDIVRAMKNVDLTLISDEHDYFGGEYDVNAIPHMIIIGRDGRIAAIHIGYGESEIPMLVKEINGLWTTPGTDADTESPASGPEKGDSTSE